MFRLRQCGIGIPIVAITSHVHREDLQRCIKAGATQSVTKSFSKQELCNLVARYIGLSERSADMDETASGNPRIARAAIKFLNRLERTVPQLRTAHEQRDWRRMQSLIHPLTSGRMFGFGSVTETVRELAISLRRLTQAQDEIVAKAQYLELLASRLDLDRARLVEWCAEPPAESSRTND
jgi:CheY-like chemotaxis protein